jgi:hypothetical protein
MKRRSAFVQERENHGLLDHKYLNAPNDQFWSSFQLFARKQQWLKSIIWTHTSNWVKPNKTISIVFTSHVMKLWSINLIWLLVHFLVFFCLFSSSCFCFLYASHQFSSSLDMDQIKFILSKTPGNMLQKRILRSGQHINSCTVHKDKLKTDSK